MSEELSDFNKKLQKAMGLTGVSKKPYISINKLAEYMTASALRRRQIIKNLKKDSDFFKVYYSELKNNLKNYFKSDYDIGLLLELIDKIEEKEEVTDWDKTDNANTILAIEHLMESNLPDLTDYEFVKDTFSLKEVSISGVRVTIKPDMYIKHKKTGKVGAIKSHIAKTAANQLNDDSRMYAATLIKFAFVEHGFKEKDIDNKACISYDIFMKDYSVSPGAYRRTLLGIEAACEEIALRWDNI